MRSASARGITAFSMSIVLASLAASVVGCASAAPADPDTIAQRATAVGMSPDLIYVTAVDGYDLAPQSVGLTGGAGISGSSDIRWGSWGESAGGEEHAEPVVVAVAEAAGEAAVQLDDPVHGLSAAVR